MRKALKGVLVLLCLVVLAGQLLPYPKAENPPEETEVAAPAEVRGILRASCYDCHSHETVWPWYSHVVPAKWLVRNHVTEGREHLNFSAWNRYDAQRAARKLEEVVEMVEKGAMPLQGYVALHKGAELTPDEAELLIRWARELAAGGGGGD